MLVRLIALLAVFALAVPASAQTAEDAGSMVPQFKEGDVISLDQVEKLRPYLPTEFWDNRDFFFYEGMRLEIGPTQADYKPADAYLAATAKFKGQPQIGPDNSLENYVAGQPFDIDEIDCLGDPQAGTKVMWSFDYSWKGAGGSANFYYSYWDRGEELPLYYQGTGRTLALSARPEPQTVNLSLVLPAISLPSLSRA